MKYLLIIVGGIALALGTLGIFLPVLPTTPFYLLTAWCWFRSSEKLYLRVMENPFFGETVRNYYEKRAISRRTKLISVSTTLLTIGLSIVLVDILWVRILLGCVAVGVSIHLLSMKTCD